MFSFDLYDNDKHYPINYDEKDKCFKVNNPHYHYTGYFRTPELKASDFMEVLKKFIYASEHYYCCMRLDISKYIDYDKYKLRVKKIIFDGGYRLCSIVLKSYIKCSIYSNYNFYDNNNIITIHLSEIETLYFKEWIEINKKKYKRKMYIVDFKHNKISDDEYREVFRYAKNHKTTED